MTLYELTDEYRQLLELADDPDVSDEVFQDTLAALGGEIEVKADSYAVVMKELEASSMKLIAEIKRLTKNNDALEKHIEKMKEDLQAAMIATGKTKFKTELFNFYIQKNPVSVLVPDESKVPEQFLSPQPPKVNKTAIKDFLKSLDENDTCSWAELTQGESLRIR